MRIPHQLIPRNNVDDSQEYVEDTAESSLTSNEEDYPPLFMSQYKEPKVSKVNDYEDGMIEDPISQRKLEPATISPKKVRTNFHTFTLDDVKVSQ